MEGNTGKRVCIIGAGTSGLVAIKSCLEEGLEPICYEKTDNVGGLWRYREKTVEGVGSVMKSTFLNTSKELTTFSDFPPPKHFPNFMHNSLLCHYLELYAKHFRLLPHIQYETEVLKVEKAADYQKTGKWSICIRDKAGGITREPVDAVMVCTGHHAYPNTPKIHGMSDFKGRVLHSHEYKTDDEFKDKRVLIVGAGSSAGDAAAELSRSAKQVYLSTRRGVWVMSRLAEGGCPVDIKYKTRIYGYLTHYVASNLLNTVAEAKANFRFDHTNFSLKPKHRFFSQHPMVNDELPSRLITGTLTIKDDIYRFTEKGVVFKGEEDVIHEVDAVVLATGYNIAFPFLEEGVIRADNNQVSLYKYVFPPQLPHASLVVIGLLQVLGPLAPLSEMQSRWATKVFKGTCHLPPESSMLLDINEKRLEIERLYFDSNRHTVQVDYIWYQDEIAQRIGVMPNLPWLFMSDPELWWACISGPNVPYIYRLKGPHSWRGARDAVLSTKNRVWTPLRTRPVAETTYKEAALENLYIAPIFTIVAAILITFFSAMWSI